MRNVYVIVTHLLRLIIGLLLMLLISVEASAYDFKVDGLCYNILSETNQTVELTWETVGKNYEGEIIVPNKVSYQSKTYDVIGIGKCAFVKVTGLNDKGECNNWDRGYNNTLTKVVLSSEISYIGDYSFDGCGSLIEVVFPSKLTSIGNQSFYACSKITDIDLSSTEIVSIGESSFSSCYKLKGISLPRTIKSIGKYAFASSYNLDKILVEASNPHLCVKDNVVFNREMSSLIMCAPGKSGECIVPDEVKRIEDTAFSECEKMTKVVLPQTITYIGKDAFCYCRGLHEISLPNGIKEIQYGAFRECSFTSVTLPNSLTYIGSEAFSCKTLEKIVSQIAVPFSIDKYVFGSESYNNIYSKATVIVPQGSLYKYKQTEGWNLFQNILENKPTYTLSIKSIGSGSASYDGTTIRSKTSSFTVNEGTSATITFAPDNGYRIKSVKINNTDITSSISNNQYTIKNVNQDTTVEVEFESIPPTIYTLSIYAYGDGYAKYNGETIRNGSKYFIVNEGANATIYLTPDDGYRIKSVKENNSDVTSSVWNYQYTVNNINWNTTIEIEFEAIPVTTYTLSIKAIGNGSASYDGTTVRSGTRSFTVTEGASATIVFAPDNGYRILSVKVNNSDVTSIVSNQFTISNIVHNTTVEVEFAEILSTFAVNGVNYFVLSDNDKTVHVSNCSYGAVLEVPATVTYQGTEWTIIGIESNALANNQDIAAVIWNPTANFTVSVSNPNLLIYVKSASYAPATIKNVIVNNVADNITLTDAAEGNNFYCPQEFTARKISYTHNYGMATGIGESKGWETIALPFDVQRTKHSDKGEIIPYIKWDKTDGRKPYWLMELGTSGFEHAEAIKANTPYIISMPNHTNYREDYRLNGNVTFSAENVTVRKSDNLHSTNFGGNTFSPNFLNQAGAGVYELNVSNDYVTYIGDSTEGSRFIFNLRPVHPFEAYMTSESATRSVIEINDNMAMGIDDFRRMMNSESSFRVYNLSGQLILTETKKNLDELNVLLPAGIYVVNGQKLIIR